MVAHRVESAFKRSLQNFQIVRIESAASLKEVQLQSKLQAANVVSANEFQRSVLSIIEECSPCSEPKLFITAIQGELPCGGDKSLADLRDRLVQCAQNLKSHGLIEIDEDDYIFLATASPDDHDGKSREGSNEQEAEDKKTDTNAEVEHRSVAESREDPSELALDAQRMQTNVLDLTPELENALEPEQEDNVSPEPAKEGASLTEAEGCRLECSARRHTLDEA